MNARAEGRRRTATALRRAVVLALGLGLAGSLALGTVAPAPASATSATSGVHVAKSFARIGVVSITGANRVGTTLTAHPGSWSPRPTFAYRWLRSSTAGSNGTAIPGATKSTYKLTAADAGRYLRVRITASRAGYTSRVVVARLAAKTADGWATSSIPRDGWWYAPTGDVFVTSSQRADCQWRRYDSAFRLVGSDRHGGLSLASLDAKDTLWTSGCGAWVPLSTTARPLLTTFAGTGAYAVGHHIRAGLYASTGTLGSCTTTRLSSFAGDDDAVIERTSHGSLPFRMWIESTDAGFEATGCGTFVLIAQ